MKRDRLVSSGPSIQKSFWVTVRVPTPVICVCIYSHKKRWALNQIAHTCDVCVHIFTQEKVNIKPNVVHRAFCCTVKDINVTKAHPRREARDVWCLPTVWNLRAVIWFHFAVTSLVLLSSPVTLSIISFFCLLVLSSELFPENSSIFFR